MDFVEAIAVIRYTINMLFRWESENYTPFVPADRYFCRQT